MWIGKISEIVSDSVNRNSTNYVSRSRSATCLSKRPARLYPTAPSSATPWPTSTRTTSSKPPSMNISGQKTFASGSDCVRWPSKVIGQEIRNTELKRQQIAIPQRCLIKVIWSYSKKPDSIFVSRCLFASTHFENPSSHAR
jgi:hypothetical protein